MSATEYSSTSVEARLRLAARLSVPLTAATPRVDMSGAAIDRRLQEAAELAQACFSLREAGRAAGHASYPR